MSSKIRIIDNKGFGRTILRLSHEIIEQNKGVSNLALVGIRTRGEFLAKRIAKIIHEVEKTKPRIGFLDITLYRDDLREKLNRPILKGTDISFDVTGKDIIIVDDVLFTGRTVRAALDELVDLGRAATIQLAVLIDRGHREIPIRADFIGKSIPTSKDEKVMVMMNEIDGEDGVYIIKGKKG